MPVEQALDKSAADVETQIKMKLLERHMTQVELSDLIAENSQSVNRAIHGANNQKSKAIREKIYRVLDM